MKIRKSREEDIEALGLLFQLTRQKTFTSVSSDKFNISDYRKSVEGEDVWVAEENRNVIGFISIWYPDNFIHNLFIHPDWQRHGIGQQLLKKAEECLLFPIELKVIADNFKACIFYEKHGYEEIAIRNDGQEDYVLYRKYKP